MKSLVPRVLVELHQHPARDVGNLYAYGVSELYTKLAARAASRLGITPKVVHMDTTSFHVDGEYHSDEPPDENSKLIHMDLPCFDDSPS